MAGKRVLLFFRRSLDREPMVVLSCALGGVGVAFALLGPPIRRQLGYETYAELQRARKGADEMRAGSSGTAPRKPRRSEQ